MHSLLSSVGFQVYHAKSNPSEISGYSTQTVCFCCTLRGQNRLRSQTGSMGTQIAGDNSPYAQHTTRFENVTKILGQVELPDYSAGIIMY